MKQIKKRVIKQFTLLLLIVVTVFFATACGKSKDDNKDVEKSQTNTPVTDDSTDNTGEEEDNEPVTGNTDEKKEETPVVPDKEDTKQEEKKKEETMEEKMIRQSLMVNGNNYRIKKVIEKARAGEDVTIGFIGGSITEAPYLGNKKSYTKLVYEYFKDTYGTGDNVHYVNAGLSGTPSILGLIRSDRDLFSKEPDLVFIEFAVNDGTEQIDNTGYESLIQKTLRQENEPAVIILYSVFEWGSSCQNNQNSIVYGYNLPRISMRNAIWNYIDSGELKWSDWADDYVHPNEWGHSMYAKFIINYLNTADKEELHEEYVVRDDYVRGYPHADMKMVDTKTNTDLVKVESLGSFTEGGTGYVFPDGWRKAEGKGNDSLKFTYEGRAFYIVYKDATDSRFGNADIYVDGELVTTANGYTSKGWNNPVNYCVYHSDGVEKHTVEIRMTEADSDKLFDIYTLGIVP